jgi:hypothetical protein
MKKCIDCKKKLGKFAKHNKSLRCRSCATKFKHLIGIIKSKGKNNPRYIDGRTNKQYYCVDCGVKISYFSFHAGTNHCYSCSFKYKKSTKGIPHLTTRGKNNPAYGKKRSYYKLSYNKHNFRSGWEANFAKWLDLSGIKWQYELQTFDLGNSTYTPDFYLPEFDCWIEIKGYFWGNTIIKTNTFQKRYSNLNFKILMKEELKILGVI